MDWQERAQSLRRAFTPAAPVTDTELFAGRSSQMVRVTDTVDARGEHAAIFGERGVGKTSLAAITEVMTLLKGGLAVRINCQANDTFEWLWRRIGEAIYRRVQIMTQRGQRYEDIEGILSGVTTQLTSPTVSMHEVLIALEMLAAHRDVVVFLDEFDRVTDARIAVELVDLMKTISDQALRVTLVVVGVASSVDTLITEHESIGRGLNEISMPRMSVEELREIITRSLGFAEMSAEPSAAKFIAQLSAGLPHYTHLMGLNAALAALRIPRDSITLEDVMEGLGPSLARAEQHVSRLYYNATHSTQANMYREVLLAAALTPTDDHGYFAPGDMREPLEMIMGRRLEIPSFSNHLSQFSSQRGPVMEKSGRERRPRYRFTEPLLVPYISMRGVNEQLVGPNQMHDLLTRVTPA